MAIRKNTAPAEAHSFRLTLISYPPAFKVTVTKIIRECTGCGLKEAKDLAENLPAVLPFDSLEAREVAKTSLEEGPGAVVTVEPLVVDQAEFLAGVERLKEFDASPLGEALAEAEECVSVAVALMDVSKRSLEADDGCEHEVTALEVALERLQAAHAALDRAHSMGRKAAEESGS